MEGNRKRHGRHEKRGKGPREHPGKGAQRDPAKELLWRERLAEHGRSGLSVRTYCRGAGVSEALFHYWRREIARRDAPVRVTKASLRSDAMAPERGSNRLGRPGDVSRPGFVELRPAEDSWASPDLRPGQAMASSPASCASPPVEVVLRNGRVLRVGRGFDPDLVVELVAVLEGSGSC
jgi:hypothetical protein